MATSEPVTSVASLAENNQEATMTIHSLPLQAHSSLVRRLVQARDDPAKQRISAWLRGLDDEQLSGIGLTPDDIAVLRAAQTPSSRP
jgi:hypothetical protein